MTRPALYCGNAEPSVDELLNDPIVHRLMERDGVAPGEVRDVMAAARRQRHSRDPRTWLTRPRTAEPAKSSDL